MNRRTLAAFAVLCLLAGTGPVLDGFISEAPAGLFGTGLRLLLLAAAFAFAGLRVPGSWGSARIALWGGVLLAGLPVAFAGASGKVSGPTEFLVFALIPATVVFFESQRISGFGAERGTFALLAPALAGLAGAALLITYAVPISAAGMLLLALMLLLAAATGFAIVQLHGLFQGISPLRATAVFCAGGAGSSLLFSWIGRTPIAFPHGPLLYITVARLLLMDAPAMFLTVWLLGRLSPIRFSSRYLFALLVAVVESFTLAQPGLSWTIGLGVLLLAGGAATLWRGNAQPT